MAMPRSKRNRGRYLPGPRAKFPRPNSKHKSLLDPSVVSRAVLQNHPRKSFPGPIHTGSVSCGHECWHELTSTEPTLHNAFLILSVPGIKTLNLPQPQSYVAADCKDLASDEQVNTFVSGQERLSQGIDQKSVSFGFPATANCAFLSLKLPSTFLTSKQNLNCLTSQGAFGDNSSDGKWPETSQARTSDKFDTAVSLLKTGEEAVSRFPSSNKQAKAYPALKTPIAPLFSLISPSAINFPEESNSLPDLTALQPSENYKAEGWTFDDNMAPVRNPENVQASIKDVIQILYDMQSQVHGFVPETQSILIDKVSELATSLSHLQTLTSKQGSPNNPIHDIRIAPEFIDYVDDGRNPDIYTRDFVELVQRGNSVVNGKQQAFRDFSEIYAKALKDGFAGLSKDVDMVMANAELDRETESKQRDRRNGQQS